MRSILVIIVFLGLLNGCGFPPHRPQETVITEPRAPGSEYSVTEAATPKPLPPNREPRDPNLIATFTGRGIKNTRPFTVPDGWEIQWEATGLIFQIFLHTAEGKLAGLHANQQGAGKGSSYVPKGGRYYLTANATGSWKIRIVQVPSEPLNKPPPGSIATFTGQGAKTTRPFTVPDGWEIQWEAKGLIFQIFLHTAGGRLVGLPANQQGAGKGSSYQPKGGRYYMTISATGSWHVKVK